MQARFVMMVLLACKAATAKSTSKPALHTVATQKRTKNTVDPEPNRVLLQLRGGVDGGVNDESAGPIPGLMSKTDDQLVLLRASLFAWCALWFMPWLFRKFMELPHVVRNALLLQVLLLVFVVPIIGLVYSYYVVSWCTGYLLGEVFGSAAMTACVIVNILSCMYPQLGLLGQVAETSACMRWCLLLVALILYAKECYWSKSCSMLQNMFSKDGFDHYVRDATRTAEPRVEWTARAYHYDDGKDKRKVVTRDVKKVVEGLQWYDHTPLWRSYDGRTITEPAEPLTRSWCRVDLTLHASEHDAFSGRHYRAAQDCFKAEHNTDRHFYFVESADFPHLRTVLVRPASGGRFALLRQFWFALASCLLLSTPFRAYLAWRVGKRYEMAFVKKYAVPDQDRALPSRIDYSRFRPAPILPESTNDIGASAASDERALLARASPPPSPPLSPPPSPPATPPPSPPSP